MPLVTTGNRSPFHVLFGKDPSYHHLRSFGCLVYARDNRRALDKFAERGRACIFVGYPSTQRGYRVFDLEDKRIYTSRDVKFLEAVYPYHLHANPSSTFMHAQSTRPSPVITEPVWDEDVIHESSSADPVLPISPAPDPRPSSPPSSPAECISTPGLSTESSPSSGSDGTSCPSPLSSLSTSSVPAASVPIVEQHLRRGDRLRKPSVKLHDFVVDLPNFSGNSTTAYPIEDYLTYQRLSQAHHAFVAAVTSHDEPRFFHQAVRQEQWRAAMVVEYRALEANGTWELCYLPPGKRAIACRWVYKIKFNADGTIERFKARLVAKGFTQIEGIDYHDTFAPVAKLVTVRCLLAVAVSRGWIIHQLDVNNTFLHGDLEEEVYMTIPQGFAAPGDTRVCRLRKSIYGLRQASRNWYQKFTQALLELNFVQSRADHALFTYRRGAIFVVALIYVDDVILTGNDMSFIQCVKDFLNDRFTIKDLGDLKYFLGIEVARSPRGMVLNQRKYMLDILAESGLTAARPSPTPIEQSHHLGHDPSAPAADPASFRRHVGRLLYLIVTRPDITYAVNILSQAVQSPTQAHVDAAARVLRYLKSCPGRGLFLSASRDLTLTAYCDADWAGCPLTRRSTTGFFITLGSSPISWRTIKQSVVARSSAEAEYRAMANTVSEVLWLRWLLCDLGVRHTAPTPIYCDNQAALHISANPVFHERTKHVELDCYFVRERVQSGDVLPLKIATADQPADTFTKGLSVDQFSHLLVKFGLLDIHSFA
ncbi:unnamed protein product [Linum trigynum]|uniref:Reverse transcriptase Ty1/copia-type domain-containing protein n=1 Tax=Linum trigynum TaxID=586398 RepID=A0AAV2FNX4_9ROSI